MASVEQSFSALKRIKEKLSLLSVLPIEKALVAYLKKKPNFSV
jgi:hypothetical protein